MSIPSLILASASPARKRLLETAGIYPRVHPSDFDESTIHITNPSELVKALAYSKAEAVSAKFSDSLILGCDSVLALNGDVFGKPANSEEAIARWHQMRGRVGELYTGHALIDQTQQKSTVRCQVTQVHFALVSDLQIVEYVSSGEPLYCAGCFALEGKGGLFVEKIEGCHSNVIGLSLPLFRRMVEELGYDITLFWR